MGGVVWPVVKVMIDYSLCEVRNMNIEIGGISIVRTVTKPASDENKVDLKNLLSIQFLEDLMVLL